MMFFLKIIPYILLQRIYSLPQFIIISSLEESKVYYEVLPSFESLTLEPNNKLSTPNVLISDLKAPSGLVYYRNSALLVSDIEAQKIYMYDLIIDREHNLLDVVNRLELVIDIPGGVRWMACDNIGNVFYTVESESEIFQISVAQVTEARLTNHPAMSPTVLYQGGANPKISQPSGIVADDFFLYWGNKENGGIFGSVVSSYSRPFNHTTTTDTIERDKTFPKALATNENKVHGLCSVDHELYYTSPTALYAIDKKGEGKPAVVTKGEMTAPRGCAYDGDGTIYVADKGTNAIYTFPAHKSGTLRKVKKLKKTIELPTPMQIVLIDGATSLVALLWLFFI